MNNPLSIQVSLSKSWRSSWKSIMNTLLGSGEEKIMHQKILEHLINGRLRFMCRDNLLWTDTVIDLFALYVLVVRGVIRLIPRCLYLLES